MTNDDSLLTLGCTVKLLSTNDDKLTESNFSDGVMT